MKRADVSVSMGVTGTDIAKESADIILADDNIDSLTTAILRSWNLHDNIRKYIQFNLTVNIVALILITAGAMTMKESPLQPIQLLWINFVVNFMAVIPMSVDKTDKDKLM